MGFSTSFHYKQIREATEQQQQQQQQQQQWEQQCSCSVPIGWSFNPQLVELFPTLLQWHSRHSCGGRFELVGDWCDGTGLPDSVGSTSERAVISFAAGHRRNLAGVC